MRMNASCRCVLRLGSPLCVAEFAALSPARSDKVRDRPDAPGLVTLCFNFLRYRKDTSFSLAVASARAAVNTFGGSLIEG
jgi:hypothetical protein